MRTSCIAYPARDPLILIRKSQIDFCRGDVCAAALLSYFEYWHNVKLDQAQKQKQANEVAQQHGDAGTPFDLWQFHSMSDLETGILGIYGRTTINNAIEVLCGLGVLTVSKNPNPRYKFDKTRYFLFDPAPINAFLRYGNHSNDQPVLADRSAKNSLPSAIFSSPSAENSLPSAKNGGPITETTSEITTENTAERKEDPGILDLKGASSAVVSSLPSGANNKKPTAQADLIVPSDVVAPPAMMPGQYMPGLPDPRQQSRTGIVATIDSYREQWRKLGFDEKRWQAYCKLLSDTCGLTALIDVADDEVELNNVRRAAITLIKLGYSNLDQLKDLIEAYRKVNDWRKTMPTLSALEKYASARNQQQTDGSDANGQTGQAARIVIEYPNPVDIEMYPDVDPHEFTWFRQVITSRKEYEQLYLKPGYLHRVISGYDANSAAK